MLRLFFFNLLYNLSLKNIQFGIKFQINKPFISTKINATFEKNIMIQISIAYLLPFILIFIFFGKLCANYQSKSGLRIFFALLIFFGTQIFCITTTTVSILVKSKKITPEKTVFDYAYHIHILSFVLASLAVFFYYNKLKQKFIKNKSKNNENEIETLGKN